MPTDFSIWFDHDILKRIISVWQASGQEAYLVGGAVRDGLLGRLTPAADLDLLVARDALAVSRRLADALGTAFYPVDPVRGVGRVVFADRRYLDIADFRADTLAGDLRDRDFTINAIALKLDPSNSQLIDPTDGQADLRAKIIRVASNSAIQNDPLRAVRGVRLAQTLGFQIDAATGARISAGAAGLTRISAERLRDELLKCWRAPSPGAATDMLRGYGLLTEILPEVLSMVGVKQSLPHRLPVWEHSLRVMDNCRELTALKLPELSEFQPELTAYFQTELPGMLSRAELMPLAALLHDAGKPQTKSMEDNGRIRFLGHEKVSADIADAVLRRFHFSDAARKFVVAVVRHHMRPLLLANEPAVSARAVHRFLIAVGDAAPAVALFALCDYRAMVPNGRDERFLRGLTVVQRVLARYFAPAPPRLLSGADVIAALGISEGREVGEWLRRLNEAQAVGEISTRAEALAFLQR